jgi:hypothetical protein
VTAAFSRYRTVYKGHLLSYEPALLDNGRLQARIAITALGGQPTIAQRFIDLHEFDTEAEAIECAKRAGMDWVDSQHG